MRRTFFVLMAALATLAGIARADEPRLDPNVAPRREAIELNLDADKEHYSGSVIIDLHVTVAPQRLLIAPLDLPIETHNGSRGEPMHKAQMVAASRAEGIRPPSSGSGSHRQLILLASGVIRCELWR